MGIHLQFRDLEISFPLSPSFLDDVGVFLKPSLMGFTYEPVSEHIEKAVCFEYATLFFC